MNVEARPVADPDPMTEPWWDATREGRLLIQRCAECGHHQHYPRPVCTSCHSASVSFVVASGKGTVYSFSVSHRSPQPAFEPPYVVALVRLEEGPVLLTNIVGCPPEEVACDIKVHLLWEELPDGRKLPLFTPQGA